MGKDRSPWQDGRRAWERLNGWHQDEPSARPGHPDDGHGALAALADIGLVRRLLEQAELGAVRTARSHGKSWAEIATRLGVTRQSAWERWRDLDEAASPQIEAARPEVESPGEGARQVEAEAAAAVVKQAARERRRRSSTVVPNVVGLTWGRAREVLYGKGLVAVGSDPDAAPPTALGWPGAVVTDQSPESGAKVPTGSSVTLWVERGGGSGVREPRRPRPTPRAARGMVDETSDEAVG